MMIDTLFLTMFVGLFAITAPIADLPLFVAATEGQSGRERRKTALIATTTYLVACGVALFAGNAALAFFGVSVPGLRLAGMAVVAAIGWKMVTASGARIAIQEPAAPLPCPSPRSVGITPLGFPIYAGPGALSVIIARGSGPEPVYTFSDNLQRSKIYFRNLRVLVGIHRIMDWKNHENFNTPWLLAFAIGGLVFWLGGAILLYMRWPIRRRARPKAAET